MTHHFRNFRPFVHIPMILGGLVLAAVLAFLFGLFVMLLWNWLMPAIFGLGEITYWQGWGLVVLAAILFKMGPHSGNMKHHDTLWKQKFRDRFERKFSAKEGEAGPSTGPSDDTDTKD